MAGQGWLWTIVSACVARMTLSFTPLRCALLHLELKAIPPVSGRFCPVRRLVLCRCRRCALKFREKPCVRVGDSAPLASQHAQLAKAKARLGEQRHTGHDRIEISPIGRRIGWLIDQLIPFSAGGRVRAETISLAAATQIPAAYSEF